MLPISSGVTPVSRNFIATDPAGYEVFMGRWSRRLALPFLDFVGIETGARVLDAGCGTGITSLAAADRGATVIGVDPSQSYLEFAKRHSAHPNITYELGDARAVRFEDASFDIAISCLMLDVVPYADEIVGELHRTVRPGGAVASVLQEKRSAFTPISMVLDAAAVSDPAARTLRDQIMGHSLIWPGGQAELWRRIGFMDVEEVPLVVPYDYASFDDYWGHF
jgi:SAM-dependent methyltransferase